MTSHLPPGFEVGIPAGIVENTAETYGEVASYQIVPQDKIWGYWRVYTTTQRKLADPTARRLENFWWHVWSDPRRLSGAALARIFKEISTGPTFRPLKCPPNRVVRQPMARFSQHEDDAQAKPQLDQPGSSGESDEYDKDSNDATSDTLAPGKTSSSAKPAPKHSILKKLRGPSASGPRPTARFISPHGSDDEANKGEAPSSGSASGSRGKNNGMLHAPTNKVEKKPTAPVTKKFVAASASSKRRPALPRRQSSQSSAASEALVSSRETTSSSRSIVPSPLGPEGSARMQRGSSGSSQSSYMPQMSAKAAGKRPATQTAVSRSQGSQGSQPTPERPVIVQTPNPMMRTHSIDDARRNSDGWTVSGGVRPARSSFAHGSRATILNSPPHAQRMIRSQSHADAPRPRDISLGGTPPTALASPLSTSAATTATSTIAALGTIDSENPDHTVIHKDLIARGMQIHSRPTNGSSSRASTSEILAAHFTPTPPSPNPPFAFGRSQSQLRLVLERDKERIGEVRSRTFSNGHDHEPFKNS